MRFDGHITCDAHQGANAPARQNNAHCAQTEPIYFRDSPAGNFHELLKISARTIVSW